MQSEYEVLHIIHLHYVCIYILQKCDVCSIEAFGKIHVQVHGCVCLEVSCGIMY